MESGMSPRAQNEYCRLLWCVGERDLMDTVVVFGLFCSTTDVIPATATRSSRHLFRKNNPHPS